MRRIRGVPRRFISSQTFEHGGRVFNLLADEHRIVLTEILMNAEARCRPIEKHTDLSIDASAYACCSVGDRFLLLAGSAEGDGVSALAFTVRDGPLKEDQVDMQELHIETDEELSWRWYPFAAFSPGSGVFLYFDESSDFWLGELVANGLRFRKSPVSLPTKWGFRTLPGLLPDGRFVVAGSDPRSTDIVAFPGAMAPSFEQIGSMPGENRYGVATVVLKQRFLIGWGGSTGNYSDDLWVLDLRTGRLSSVRQDEHWAPGDFWATLVLREEYLYLIGGYSGLSINRIALRDLRSLISDDDIRSAFPTDSGIAVVGQPEPQKRSSGGETASSLLRQLMTALELSGPSPSAGEHAGERLGDDPSDSETSESEDSDRDASEVLGARTVPSSGASSSASESSETSESGLSGRSGKSGPGGHSLRGCRDPSDSGDSDDSSDSSGSSSPGLDVSASALASALAALALEASSKPNLSQLQEELGAKEKELEQAKEQIASLERQLAAERQRSQKLEETAALVPGLRSEVGKLQAAGASLRKRFKAVTERAAATVSIQAPILAVPSLPCPAARWRWNRREAASLMASAAAHTRKLPKSSTFLREYNARYCSISSHSATKLILRAEWASSDVQLSLAIQNSVLAPLFSPEAVFPAVTLQRPPAQWLPRKQLQDPLFSAPAFFLIPILKLWDGVALSDFAALLHKKKPSLASPSKVDSLLSMHVPPVLAPLTAALEKMDPLLVQRLEQERCRLAAQRRIWRGVVKAERAGRAPNFLYSLLHLQRAGKAAAGLAADPRARMWEGVVAVSRSSRMAPPVRKAHQ